MSCDVYVETKKARKAGKTTTEENNKNTT
ncbi:MAG: hypothetical protein K0Q67_1996, partial [Cellvibrio sp.]|nr:hypothetical protein [Cellvibrio sp.]